MGLWELHGFIHVPILFLRHDFDGRSEANLESNSSIAEGDVRNLDILTFDLIQKITHNKVVVYMCTCTILSLLGLEINIANTNVDILEIKFKFNLLGLYPEEGPVTTVDILKIKFNRLGLYPEERPVPKAPAAPFALVDIVRCLK